MTTSAQATTRPADSTDRTPVLPVAKATPTQVKAPAARFGDTARRFLNTLMRSLASAHV